MVSMGQQELASERRGLANTDHFPDRAVSGHTDSDAGDEDAQPERARDGAARVRSIHAPKQATLAAGAAQGH